MAGRPGSTPLRAPGAQPPGGARGRLALAALCAVLASCAAGPAQRPVSSGAPSQAAVPPLPGKPPGGPAALSAAQLAQAGSEVRATDQAFARTLATHNYQAFLSYLSPDAIFFNGTAVDRGRARIGALWRPYFTAAQAPFSWMPDFVVVVNSGTLALTSGPIMQQGHEVSRYSAVWRLEAPHTWRIVFDRGEAVCNPQD